MKNDKVTQLTDKLEEGLLRLKDSEEYKKYLTCMSKFHSYSFNNSLLIMMQCPQASYVAGFNSWKNNFKRNVKKGEKGIKILAPAPIKKKVMVEKQDNNGKVVKDEEEMVIPFFKPVTVFDISQTEGEPIPELIEGELKGDVKDFNVIKTALLKISPVPIREEELSNGSKEHVPYNNLLRLIYYNNIRYRVI